GCSMNSERSAKASRSFYGSRSFRLPQERLRVFRSARLSTSAREKSVRATVDAPKRRRREGGQPSGLLSSTFVGFDGREWWTRFAASALALATLASPARAQPSTSF